MKKIITFVLVLLFASFVTAESYTKDFGSVTTGSNTPNLNIVQLKYDPYPVNPGDYFTLWLKAENNENAYTDNAEFELLPEYPFSLDSNENALRSYGSIGSKSGQVVMEYKVRVADDAVSGDNEIKLRYRKSENDPWFTESFNIIVNNAMTDFDLVVQESQDNTIVVALANTGKENANSVIVKIPSQKNFEATGTSGQMVGTLDNGDYTLISFEVAKKRSAENNTLKFQIDYTDTIGERRNVIKEVTYAVPTRALGTAAPDAATNTYRQGNSNFRTQQTKSLYQQPLFWVGIFVVLGVGWGVFRKVQDKKRREKLKSERRKRYDNENK